MPGLTTSLPFPDDVPTHPLLVIDYQLVKADDAHELNKLWRAATELGFWYLKNHGMEAEVDAMFDVGMEALDLPLEEKMKYEQGDSGYSFGYKARGTIATDKNGARDTVEFLNIAQDDALSWPRVTHRVYPEPVNRRMNDTVVPFTKKSIEINLAFLAVFERRLGLPMGELVGRHQSNEISGGEARCIRSPPRQTVVGLGAHTDFGSLAIVHNRLGGLQVLPPGQEKWLYVKPVPGHAVCNIGDSLSIFSGGLLRSNVHRVMPPPGEQTRLPRYSISFFTRAADRVMLNSLKEHSSMIAEAVSKSTENFDTGFTAGEWVARRIRKLRIKNRTGPETWYESMGTEHRGLFDITRPIPTRAST